jgi:hypothetical protein
MDCQSYMFLILKKKALQTWKQISAAVSYTILTQKK